MITWQVKDVLYYLEKYDKEDFVIFQHRLGSIENMKKLAEENITLGVVDDDGYRLFANAPPSLDVIIGVCPRDYNNEEEE